MNFKTTVALLVLLVLIGVYLAVQHFTANPAGSAPEAPAGNKLVSATPEQINRVRITHPDGTEIVLVRGVGDAWRIARPIDAPADRLAVDDLLRQITALQSRGQLPADRTASVGLDKPRAMVEVTTADGKATRLSFGDQNKVGDSLYVLLGSDPKPQIVGTAINAQLDKPAADYRSKQLTDLSTGGTDVVRQLAITRDGKTVRLEKQGTDWTITDPKRMPADTSSVSSLLFAIADLNAGEFVPNPSAPASYGLTRPTMTVWYSNAAPTTQPATQPAAVAASQDGGHTIAFGRFESLEQKNVYASVDGGPIAVVPVTSETAFEKTPLELRDKKVLDIDPAHVESVTLAVNRPATTQPTTRPAEQSEYTIARRKEVLGPLPPPGPTTGPASAPSTEPASQPAASQPGVAASQPALAPPTSKWVFQSGATGDAIDADVQSLLDALHPLRAEKFLDAPPAPATQPAAQYTLTVHAGPANGQGPRDYTLRVTGTAAATGPVTGSTDDLTFELDRSIVDKLEAAIKRK